MKKLSVIFLLILCLCTGCVKDKAGILFNKHPITEKNIFDCSSAFKKGTRIYYVILMPKKVESRYLYLQIIKKDNDYGRIGYDLVMSRDIRLKDEEIRYYTDYFVINQKGFYGMKVYSKDNPRVPLAVGEFYVEN